MVSGVCVNRELRLVGLATTSGCAVFCEVLESAWHGRDIIR